MKADFKFDLRILGVVRMQRIRSQISGLCRASTVIEEAVEGSIAEF